MDTLVWTMMVFQENGSFDEKSFAFSHTCEFMTISVVSFLERDTKIDGYLAKINIFKVFVARAVCKPSK